MIPYPYDITLDKGSTYELEFYVLDDDNTTPYYFVGTNSTQTYICRMQIRRSYLSEIKLVDVSTDPSTDQYQDDYIMFDETEDGLIKIRISAYTTKTLPPGKHFYDVELEDAQGVVKKLMKGRVEILGEITR
jgi:hypothetical protein